MVRAAIDELVAEGLPLVSITQTQLRMRLGGGSWQTLRDELERARGQAVGRSPEMPTDPLGEQTVPADLAARVDSLERLLTQTAQEVRALRADIDRLVGERAERRQPSADPAPTPDSAGDRRAGRKRKNRAAGTD